LLAEPICADVGRTTKLVSISAPRGKTAAQCERQFVCAAISIVVAETSFMKNVLKLTAMLGLAVLMIPLSAHAQEQKHEQNNKGAPHVGLAMGSVTLVPQLIRPMLSRLSYRPVTSRLRGWKWNRLTAPLLKYSGY
jgi:hypothetical protein